jgi:hypothetical protein
MRHSINALQPTLDSNGRLVCQAYEVSIDMDDRIKCTEWSHDWSFIVRMRGGESDAHVSIFGSTSTNGKVYIRKPDLTGPSLPGRILVFASNSRDGAYHMESTGVITY